MVSVLVCVGACMVSVLVCVSACACSCVWVPVWSVLLCVGAVWSVCSCVWVPVWFVCSCVWVPVWSMCSCVCMPVWSVCSCVGNCLVRVFVCVGACMVSVLMCVGACMVSVFVCAHACMVSVFVCLCGQCVCVCTCLCGQCAHVCACLYGQCVWVPVSVCMYALRIVSVDKILCLINTLIIIIVITVDASENAEPLKGSPFKALSRPEYSLAWLACCQEFFLMSAFPVHLTFVCVCVSRSYYCSMYIAKTSQCEVSSVYIYLITVACTTLPRPVSVK